MPSTNGCGPKKRAVLYARVSTDEQARSGYSLAQQLEALREYVAREGYEVLEEIVDPGQSGASLERPGMDRVRDLVSTGDISIVLAQDRDRVARKAAYNYLLQEEFAEYGCELKALNDYGDSSAEGVLMRGIQDQFAEYERAKTAERSRRGKLHKAREGKIVAGHTPNYGFRFNATRDGYLVDEEPMRIVRRIFQMVGAEGRTLHAVKMALEREGVQSPGGGKYWNTTFIRSCILDDVYLSHSFEEVEMLVTPEVAAKLHPKERYGVWWFNRRRARAKQVVEVGENGRSYRRKVKVAEKPKDQWVAVPVPDSGIPREWVEAAREAIKDNRPTSTAGDRFWELSGGILYCGGCGFRMSPNRVLQPRSKKPAHYYRCPTRQKYKDGCSQSTHYRADKIEPGVWSFVGDLLKDPDWLRQGIERMIEQERNGLHGDPEREARVWREKLAEADRMRSGYQELAAKGLMTFDELRVRLAEFEETRELALHKMEALEDCRVRLQDLERDRDSLLETYAGMMPEVLDKLASEERRQIYWMLRLRVVAQLDGSIEINGTLGAGLEDGLDVCKSITSSGR
jgi:site-specific DNA recombinase